MKIVVLDGYAINPGDISWDVLKRFGTVVVYGITEEEKIARHIGDANIVLTNRTPLKQDVFDTKPNIEYVGMLATGFDNVDVAAARQHGIPVCNIPEYGTSCIAEMVFALLLELCRNIAAYSDAVKDGEWADSQYNFVRRAPVVQLGGKTMGIIGLGKIGKKVADIAQAFGMKVLAHTRHRENVCENRDDEVCRP